MVRIALIRRASLEAVNARRPATISYSTQPNARMSVRASTSRPSSCSGAMYGRVPSRSPWAVSAACVVSTPSVRETGLARPKSSSFACGDPAEPVPALAEAEIPPDVGSA